MPNQNTNSKYNRSATWRYLSKSGRVQTFGNNLNKSEFYSGRN